MSKLKVIIVGGGPVGLTAAHTFSKAGIDFIVLEKRGTIFEDVGASLVIAPQSLRVWGQLGFLERMQALGQPVHHIADFNMSGKKYKEGRHPELLKENHGACSTAFHRADVVEALYQELSETARAKVLNNKRVVRIESDTDGVRVYCADGTEFTGSVVVGADGVHSETRNIMRKLSLESDSPSRVSNDFPFWTEYRTMWCSFPRAEEYAAGEMLVTHGREASLQFINGSDRSWIFVYERIGEPAVLKDRSRYGEKDIELFASKYTDMPVGDKLTLGDMFQTRQTCGMANLEEGILKQWSCGRIVLAGDACHKFTPNAGLGYNSGLQDVVALTNELRRCMAGSSAAECPSMGDIEGVLKNYQDSRMAMIRSDLAASAKMTRLCAWPSNFFWFLDQWVLASIPHFDSLFFRHFISPKVSRAFCLDFLGGEEPLQGKIAWVYPIDQNLQRQYELCESHLKSPMV